MSSESKIQDWSKPAAMAIPKGGYFEDKVEQGRYGPIFPKTPACLRLLHSRENNPRPRGRRNCSPYFGVMGAAN